MKLAESTRLLVRHFRQLSGNARDILPEARSAAKKPAAIGQILLTAHRAQLTFAVLLVIMIYLAPTVVDFVTGIVFPPETSKKVFGLIKTHQENSWKYASYAVIMTILWLASIATTGLLLWLHIPQGLARANARARNLVNTAGSLGNSIKSRILLRRAFALTTDPELESELDTRLNTPPHSAGSDSSDEATVAGESGIESNTLINADQPAPESPTSPSPTALNERYEIAAELGRGAMGVVYRAWDKVLDRNVAVKQLSLVLSDDDEYISRFRREAKALAQLTHANVVQVYDLIEGGGRLWMVLEYVDGGDLASYLKESDHLTVAEAAGIVVAVAEGLAFAHDHGIVHRDLKPANILLTRDRVPKISDFGIAKLSQSSSLTQVGSVLGSPPYMSPEQCSGGSVDTRTDIYALGITLYELLSGKKPFDGETSSVLARHIVEQPPPLSDVVNGIPPEMENLVTRMLAKCPDERPSNMTEVIESLSLFRDPSASPNRATNDPNPDHAVSRATS